VIDLVGAAGIVGDVGFSLLFGDIPDRLGAGGTTQRWRVGAVSGGFLGLALAQELEKLASLAQPPRHHLRAGQHLAQN